MAVPASPARSWWPRSKAFSNKESRQNYTDPKSSAKHSSGLKSIAVAIGLKSRRPSKEPLYPGDASDTTSGPKSYSPTLSPVDSLEPFDTRLPRPRQSLLTLADDPFAGHSPVGSIVPSRFSVYSSPSVTDLTSRKTDSPFYRSSYGSSSTNSNSPGSDLNSTSMSIPHRTFPESKKLHLKRSIGSMQVKLDNLSQQTFLMSPISRSNPSAKEPPVGDDAPVRRSRGMTVGGLPQKSSFFVKEQTTRRKPSQASSTSNSVLASVKPPEPSLLPVRQTSFSSSRLFAPPTAPPSVNLPAPPQAILEQPDFHQRKGMDSLPPFSSSSPPSFVNDHITSLRPIQDDSRPSKQNLPVVDCSFGESIELSSKTSPRTLKKLPSQRSLRRASSPSSSLSSKTTTTLDAFEKRKQRNSQQCRLPMPTLSLSIRTSFVSTQPRNGDPAYPVTEQRKSRKRLFSSSSQKSSILTRVPPGEDDRSSVSSLPSDHDTIHSSYQPWAVSRNYPKPLSFWDEGPDTTPNSPAPPRVDYQPQAIMSRAELAKLEASVSNAEQETPLGSTLSFPPANGPEASEQEPRRVALSPPPSSRPERSSGWSSDATLTSSTSRSRSARRPFTADPLGKDREAAETRRRVASVAASRLDMIPDLTSLPPPPRRRLLSVGSTASTSASSTLVPSPVERSNYSKINLLDRPNTVITATNPLQPSALGTRSLPAATPAPRPIATSRGKVQTSGVLEKAIHRRSIMRKPSFLEIDGETDPESEPEVTEKRDSLFLNMKPPGATTVSNGSSKTGESFLDLARESFDTMRS